MVNTYQIYPRRRSYGNLSVNTKLILINIFIFLIVTLMIGSGILSLDYVAIKPASILQGEYLWTFFTSMFMHGNFFHIFVNMFSLFFIGGLVERILGKRRYLYFYLISGLCAGFFFVLLSLIFSADFNTFAVGASGALFGLIGLLMLITPNLSVYIMFIPIPIKMKYAAPGILIVLWIVSYWADLPIGNTAHLGGLLCGLIYGIYLRKRYKNKIKYIGKHFS